MPSRRRSLRWVSAPGDTILDLLEERAMPRQELAERLRCSLDALNAVLEGRAVLTPDIAEGLERALAVKATFWLSREQTYRAELVRREASASENLARQWVRQFP